MNHNLTNLFSKGFIPLTLETYKDVGHWMFREKGMQYNVSYEQLRAFRIDLTESWMIFIDTSKPNKSFTDTPLLNF